MITKFKQIILVFVLILSSMRYVKTETETEIVSKYDSDATTCLNPNKQTGNCISIYECNSLRYVLEHGLKNLFDFVRASECSNGKGMRPFVCCTREIRFYEDITTRYRNERIIFPNELERYKRRKFGKPEELTENKTTTTTTTTTSTTEKSQNDRLYLNNKDTNINKKIYIKTKFPRPPNCGDITFSNKIFGGKTAELGEFSWMVILEYRNLTSGQLKMDCSGSIINERYVLTAAHCVKGEILKVNGRLESVRIGEYNTDTDKDCNEITCLPSYQRLRIESVIPHAGYSVRDDFGARNHHDIALLRLEKPLKFDSTLQPACLPLEENLKPHVFETKFTVAGWGHNGARARTAVKQKVELPFFDHDKCRQIFSKKFFLTDEQLCAGGKFREDSCSGDSGGPLMRLCEEYWMLEGLVSFGLGCGLERPGIYTNLRNYLKWIDEHVKSD